MLQITVTGKLSSFRKLPVPSNERYQGIAILKEYARENGQSYERFWLLWLPKHAMAFAEIQQGKGYTVAVIAEGIAINQGDWSAAHPDARLCLAVKSIEAV